MGAATRMIVGMRSLTVAPLSLVVALALAPPARAQCDPANPEATDPDHIYVHPGEPGYNPNEPNDMPTPDPSQLYPPTSSETVDTARTQRKAG
jgi:hypothetical protein